MIPHKKITYRVVRYEEFTDEQLETELKALKVRMMNYVEIGQSLNGFKTILQAFLDTDAAVQEYYKRNGHNKALGIIFGE